jgi:hypothetical protein
MGRVVADQLERARIIAGDDLDSAVGYRIGKVAQIAVDRDGNGFLGKRFGDRFRMPAIRRSTAHGGRLPHRHIRNRSAGVGRNCR